MLSKKINLYATLTLFIGLLFTANAAFAQSQQGSQTAVLTGQVVDSEAQEPISGIELKIEGTEQTAETNKQGQFSFTGLQPGTYTVVASTEGYEDFSKEVEVSAPGKELKIQLKPSSSSQ